MAAFGLGASQHGVLQYFSAASGRHGCAQQQGAAHDSEESVAAMYAACLSHCRAESMPEERVHQDQGLQTHCSFLAHSPAQHHTPCYIGSSSAYGSSLA